MKFPKFTSIVIALFLFTLQFHSQNYTWQTGSGVSGSPGIYGTPGVPAPSNHPGSREASCSWKDLSGDFWLFGGLGAISFNDLWKYTPSINQWTFMKGDSMNQQIGVYGTQGIASNLNKPGARVLSVSWTDASGNLWMFGGTGVGAGPQAGHLNDLWKYNPATNMWTWVKGSTIVNQTGVYGTLGTPAASNKPGSRTGSVSWIDASGNLWLFGGYGYATNFTTGVLNDLWMFDIATNQWTWVGGSNIIGQAGNYGTLGTPLASNSPGGRCYAVSWVDPTGIFWLHGGTGLSSSGPPLGMLNDLWKYDPYLHEWTWMNGINGTAQPGVYGSLGVPATSNCPGSRVHAMSWSDSMGNLWLMGGMGFGYTTGPSFLDDLWQYNTSTNQWTWQRGSGNFQQPAVFGTQTIPAPLNKPGGVRGACTWIDDANNLWQFGGYGFDANTNPSFDHLNDLWRFGSCTPDYVNLTASTLSLCAGIPATLTASGASTYSWSTSQTGISINVAPLVTTTYSVVATTQDACYLPAKVTISALPLPSIVAVSSNSITCPNTSVTLSASGAVSYTWQTSETTQSISVAASATIYTVSGTGINGCVNTASVSQIIDCTDLKETGLRPQIISVFPNPSNGEFYITSTLPAGFISITIINALGQLELELNNVVSTTSIKTNLAKGLYYLRASDSSKKQYTAKLIVE